jgi:hypothetical protein
MVLAQATFTAETSSGWQEVRFSRPVDIAANTTYTAAYFTTTGYSSTGNYFLSTNADAPPLRIPTAGGNGMYSYASTPTFPTATRLANYWVDVLFAAPAAAKPTSLWPTNTPSVERIGPPVWQAWKKDAPVTLGVRFLSDVPGVVTGIRYWKASPNDNGMHVGALYSGGGTLLGQATFAANTASEWQEVKFASPVPVAANTPYVAAYFTNSGWSSDEKYFLYRGKDSGPLHAPQSVSGGTGNGLYAYGSTLTFPRSATSSNYWVDVIFVPTK